MDLLPKVGSVDRQAERRSGSGSFTRKRRDDDSGQQQSPNDEPGSTPEAPLDPLLAELDRIRAIDPAQTQSGAHRALLAQRAYQPKPTDALPAASDQVGPPAPGP